MIMETARFIPVAFQQHGGKIDPTALTRDLCNGDYFEV
jgi:hypothetical protein